MIGGQVLDMQAEGGKWKKLKNHSSFLQDIHRRKTAALIRASLQAGATLAGATPKQLKALGLYGDHIGMAFQIADDILDVVADKKKLGKRGSDVKNKKLTYATLFGLEESKRKAQDLVEEAKTALEIFGRDAQILKQLANYIIERDH
jgi:geranylgeranyl diphosphate synthase type II